MAPRTDADPFELIFDSEEAPSLDDLADEALRARDHGSEIWKSASGPVRISNMKTSHIENAMAFLKRGNVLVGARIEKLSAMVVDAGVPAATRMRAEIELASLVECSGTSAFSSMERVRKYRALRRELRKRRRSGLLSRSVRPVPVISAAELEDLM